MGIDNNLLILINNYGYPSSHFQVMFFSGVLMVHGFLLNRGLLSPVAILFIFMPLFIFFILLGISSCQTEIGVNNDEPDVEEFFDDVHEEPSPLNGSVKGVGSVKKWEIVLREVIYNPSSGLGVGPYNKEIEGSLLSLKIDNTQPFNNLSFETFLTELATRLLEAKAPFRLLVLQALGSGHTILKANISFLDVASFAKGEISQPELARRFQIEALETVESLKEKALSARKEQKNDIAMEALKQWVEREPQSVLALSLLGNVYRDEKKYWEAITIYKQLALVQPSMFVFHNLGFTYERVGAYDDAILSYQKALEFDLQNILLMQQLADLLRKNGDVNGALVWLNKAKGVSESADLWLIEGNVYRDAKDYKKAREAYVSAKKLNPDDPRITFNLLLVDLDTRQFSEAKKKYAELKSKAPLLAKLLEGVYLFEEREPVEVLE